MAARFTSRFRSYVKARPGLDRTFQLVAWFPVAYFCTQHIASIIAIEGR